jgi:ABC-type antimicrobial peptide transport system permease subunit
MIFEPISQWQRNLTEPISMTLETQTHYITSIVMNFHGTQQYLEEAAHRTLSGISPNLVIINLQSLNSQLDSNFSLERLVARLTTLFGLLALLLTAVGLYGITAYQTAMRTREIGLRMAFGANRSEVIGLTMKKAFYLVGLGLVIGLPIVLIAAHYMADQLYVVKPYDPISLCAAVFVLLAATALAGFVPARRAAAIDPVQALRSE